LRAVARADFPLDILVRDPQTLRLRVAAGDWFLREIVERGTVLHESAGGRAVA
jgi:hypothetical protein